MPSINGSAAASSVVHVAVAGLGRIGQNHALNLAALKDVRVVAVFEPNEALHPWARDNLGQDVFFAKTFTELAALPHIHLVWLATPTMQHAPQTIEAVRAGKHVFTEKPLSTNVDEAREVLRVSKEHPDILVMVGFSRRFDASYKHAAETIRSGAIGKPFLMQAKTADLSMGPASDFFYPYMKISGGIFVDCLIHDIDAAQYLLGSAKSAAADPRSLVPKRVWATGSVQEYDGLVELHDVDNAMGTVEYQDGSVLTLYGSRTAKHGYDVETTVWGSQGKVQVGDVGATSRLTLSTAIGRTTPLERGWDERFSPAFATEAKEFTDAVRQRITGRNPTEEVPRNLSVQSSVRALEIGTALQRSLREKREIRFDEQGQVIEDA